MPLGVRIPPSETPGMPTGASYEAACFYGEGRPAATASAALAANTIYYMPFQAKRTQPTASLSVVCDGAIATSHQRYGIYAWNTNTATPGDLIVAGAKELDTASTGTKTTAAVANLVEGEWYAFAIFNEKASVTLTSYNGGASVLMGNATAGSANFCTAMTQSLAYTTLPASPTAPALSTFASQIRWWITY